MLPQTQRSKLFLLRKWSLVGPCSACWCTSRQWACHLPQPRALSAAAKLQKDGKQTSGGWIWLGPCPQMCSSSCAHSWREPEPPVGAGRPVGVPLWEGLGGSEWAEVVEEGRQCAGAGPWLPVPLHGLKRVPHGGEHLRSVCLLDPDLWPLCRGGGV